MFKEFTVKDSVETMITADIKNNLKSILAKRGIDTDEKLAKFLNEDTISIRPEVFSDIDIATSRTFKAIEEGERIGIFGDYDADGVCATAILYRYLNEIGADVVVKIPSREEGYGIAKNGIDELIAADVKLIITVDNGIVAFDEVLYAKEHGIDVIVTDHHKPRENLPMALAVINPQCTNEDFLEYSGGFVALLFAAALEGDFETIFSQYGYLAAIATVADVMPLVGDNRVIVSKGLSQMKEEEIPSIDALLSLFNIKKEEINCESIGYKIAPAINSAGRIGDPVDAFVFLATDDIDEAEEYANLLLDCNAKRREIELVAVANIEENEENAVFGEHCTLIYDENLPDGIIGIIAARFVERYKKTAIVMTRIGNEIKGSVRALPEFGILECLTKAEKLLLKFGGHSAAAGFSMSHENFEKFKSGVLEHKPICDAPIFQSIEADAIATSEELTLPFAKSLEILEPYGRGNEEPVFLIIDAKIEDITPLSGGKFIKLKLSTKECVFDAVFFGSTIDDFTYPKGTTINIIASISVNRYNEREYLSVKVIDISQNPPTREDISCLNAVQNGDKENFPMVSRDDFAALYRFLSMKKSLIYDIYDISVAVFNKPNMFITYLACEIFIEAGLVAKKSIGGRDVIEIITPAKKVDLLDTKLYKQIYRERGDAN